MATRHERFEWDDDKAASNFAKHKLEFETAGTALMHDDQALEEPDTRWDYGEHRINTLALYRNQLLSVCWTTRVGVPRIISARKASREERERYAQRR